MRRFVIVGNRASSSPDFLLVDIPSTSGRLDVLLRCLRAGLLVSHGLRRDTAVYLVLQGDPSRTVTLRIDGGAARYIRPDDRSLATLVQKVLRSEPPSELLTEVKPGVALARGGIETLLSEVRGTACYLLDEQGAEMRDTELREEDCTFFLGDHVGLEPSTLASLQTLEPRTLRVGPLSLHSEDVVAITHNELDRRLAARAP